VARILDKRIEILSTQSRPQDEPKTRFPERKLVVGDLKRGPQRENLSLGSWNEDALFYSPTLNLFFKLNISDPKSRLLAVLWKNRPRQPLRGAGRGATGGWSGVATGCPHSSSMKTTRYTILEITNISNSHEFLLLGPHVHFCNRHLCKMIRCWKKLIELLASNTNAYCLTKV